MMPLLTVAKGDGSGVTAPRRVIVRTESDWKALWIEHAGDNASAPAVDFSSRMVAAAFAGDRPTPGYAIEIVKARREGDALTISVVESTPPPGSIAAQLIVTPFHIVSLPRHDGAVAFTPES
jgi:hypothetical protein